MQEGIEILRILSMLLRDNVYESLRADILSCRLAPGDDVREQDLASRYAVSRQPVREALLRLEREHLVTVQPRQGYRVNPISLSDARDLLRFRLALEPACVAEAIENAPDKMLQALDDYRRFSGNHEDFIAYNGARACLGQPPHGGRAVRPDRTGRPPGARQPRQYQGS
jgi:DNA-binding GntR family transcriptional regulator